MRLTMLRRRYIIRRKLVVKTLLNEPEREKGDQLGHSYFSLVL